MQVHEDAVDIIKIEDENLRKVCADFFSAATAYIATLYCRLPTPCRSALCCALAGMCLYVCFVWLRASSSTFRLSAATH